MKARKHIQRDRTTAGRATGELLCHLSLPALDEEHRRKPLHGNPTRAIGKIRHFVERHLPPNPDLLKGASLVIEALVRASGGGVRRKRLAKWKFGEDLDLAFKKATQEWMNLEFEHEHTKTEVEIDLLEGIERLR